MPDERKSFGALDRAVLRRTDRTERARREGVRTILQNLGMMGALGWLLAVPPLLSGFLGRWLDRTLGTGFELTAALLVAGVGLGGWLAWRRMGEAGVLGERPNRKGGGS